MKKRVLAMLLAVALIVGCFAGCGGDGNKSSTPANDGSKASTPADDGTSSTAEPSNVAAGPDDTSEHYDFTIYANFDWFAVKQWGVDAASKYLSEKFNVGVTWTKPDSDANAKLRTMLAGDELPEVICMQPGPLLNEVARGNYLQEITPFMYEGNTFVQDVPESARKMTMIDGKEYYIPVWPHGKATGGNYAWIVNTAVYEAAGSPALNTLEDLHQYMLKVKEMNPTSYSGAQVYPWVQTNDATGFRTIEPIYRSLGMPALCNTFYTQEDGKIAYGINSENYVKALEIANQWYNEGLFSADEYTWNGDQFLEILTNAQGGILWYDFSQDDTNNFRRIVREKTNNATSYEVVGYAPNYADGVLDQYPLFPAAEEGDIIYGDECGTMGWKGYMITNKATNGQRIFDLLSFMLTKEGSINMMYGPEGGLWEGLDENGNPNLKKPQSEFTSAELDAAGAWFWPHPASSDNVDLTKFAVNDKEEPENRNWTVDIQAHAMTYNEEEPRMGQKFLTDQSQLLTVDLDPTSDADIARTQIEDRLKTDLPQIIMALDKDTFDQMVKDLQDFCNSTEAGALEIMQARFDQNIAAQGFNAYDESHDVYKLNK